ncbi:MAG TPA: hypothetical protein VGX51_04030 [Solirubrobacteraceae bacterium]|jgi:hypothetical protein|nr:hypothetical protein [Solirubrobacteraceae bacterium]
MTGIWVAVAAAIALAVAAALAVARRVGGRDAVAKTVISTGPDSCTADERSGAVRSVQTADIFLPAQALQEIWTPVYLERLARTYWRYLSRVTLGLIRVVYTERERYVVLLSKRLKLITFQAPEYEMDATRGVVRWRIARGLLVARRGRDLGYLQIEVCRRSAQPGATRAQLHVEVEVANFYPAIAFGLSRRIYDATQSHIHVLITHGFLRSLARLDLAESRVGRISAQPASEQGG